MSAVGYEAFDDPYCYKGTAVLKNRIGLRDAQTLEAFEVEMSTLRAEEPLPSGRFAAAHYRRVHRHLFQDVYAWAGTYRTVRIAKGGNAFCFPEYIASEMSKLFGALKNQAFLTGRTAEEFAAGAAEFLGELNAIHPFREGNGRSQLAFMFLLGANAGHPLALARVRRATFLPAMIESFAGNLAPLRAELLALTDA